MAEFGVWTLAATMGAANAARELRPSDEQFDRAEKIAIAEGRDAILRSDVERAVRGDS